MTINGENSQAFEELIRDLLRRGLSVRFQARGASMSPAIRDGEFVEVTPVIVSKLRKDDIVLAKSHYGFRLHRVVRADLSNDVFITRGDCGQEDDPALKASQILGLARAKDVRVGRYIVQARFQGIRGWAMRSAARSQRVANSFWRKAVGRVADGKLAWTKLGIFGLLLLTAAFLSAQVAVDSTTSGNAILAGSGSPTLSIGHTTGGTNRLMIVGVSINIGHNNAAKVTGVTWNGTALTQIGAHNDTGGTRRVEQWFLLAPATGTANVIVTVNIPSAVSEGVVAGVTTFTGVDQTVPLGSFVSADGAAGTFSQLDVPSVINGMVLDTLAIGGNRGATVPGPQVTQWNTNTGGGTGGTDVTAVGTSRTGAPNVPISESFTGGTTNWSYGAVSINPSTADIGVTTNVSAVALGQNSTYTITITNNGPSPANNVTLTDTFAATNLSLVSVTPSAGTTCATTATINCTLPTPFNSGASATVTVVVSTTAAGFYPNTATITDSGTPPDPNTGNNTYVSLAPVVSVVCGTSVIGSGGTISGVINTYFPGTASVTKGATSIPIGAANGTGTIATGSLLLVIQMQDASINTSNSVAYGNGSTGSGFTTIDNAGNYEYVTATGPVSGGSVPIAGAGSGGGLVFGYTAAAASATKGTSTYQVVLVPQYTTVTLGALTASPWNGATGGILALDVAGQLNLGGATVSVDGMGFRGGAGMQLNGGVGGTNADYLFAAPATYAGAVENGVDGSKGEGVAGTPEWVESGGTFLQTAAVGYPSGTAGVDGSMAHGAPGNAGGGGTDGDPAANDQNAGGGGGANGGSGGFGGNSWNTNLSDGGQGGANFPATIDRIALGGGGGAGTRNNSDGDNQASSGAGGGGIIFIRAFNLSGSATLTANGSNAHNLTANDSGGGGGAGGTIVVLSANGGEGGLTLQANGGTGGNSWSSQTYTLANRHGPGGGGGGGVIFVSGAPASVSVSGGANGLTLNPGVPYGSTPGNAGTSTTTATLSQVTGIQSASLCTPDMTLGKSHVGNFTRGANASYTIPVSNASPYGPTHGLVTINDTLPFGITPVSATGTGWSCSTSGQTISCTRSDVLAAASAYPSITLIANVSQAAPPSLTNTATVAGGGEANLLNDSATDVANVGSTADLSMSDSASPSSTSAGSDITYTQVLTNIGPSAADNATLIAPIPPNTTFVAFTAPAGWTCTTPAPGSTGNVVCSIVNMAGGTAATFTLIARVNVGTSNGTVIVDTVSAASSTVDPNSANNTARATTVVGATSSAEVTVTNVASPNPVVAGNNITYTQVVTNTGASAATSVTFTEATPANTTFVSITPPAGWVCTAFPPTCTIASLASGAGGTFTVVYTVGAATTSGTVISDTVTVNASNQAFGASSATATDVVAAASQADVSLSTAASPSSVYAGNNITYTQTITNNGPAASTGVVFTEATPPNTTFESVSAPVGWTCTSPAVGGTGTITCNDTNALGSGSTADIVVVVNVPASVAAGNITASSSVTATTSDPTNANNSTSTVTPVTVQCDLAVTNSGSPNPVAANANITYTQVITNNGPSSCSTATFSEPTPNNTTFVSVAVVNAGGVTWTCPNTAPVACTAPTVPPGSTGTITAIYHVPTGTASGTIINDTVTVGTASHDTSNTNNSASVSIAVAGGGVADLRVTNSGSPTLVTAGNNITYTQTVTNAGPAAATLPKLVETLPANTTAVSLTGPGGWTCNVGTLTCTDTANMNSGTNATFTFIVKVNNNVASGSTITQTATVSSTTVDPNSANNSATATNYVADSADLSITNTASPVPVLANNNITYTQVVTNSGPSAATTVSITETTPPNTTFQSITPAAGWSCTTPAVNGTGTITCTNASFVPGSASFTVVLKVNAGTAAGTAINNTATVSSAVADPNSANNTATAADVVATAAQADLVVTNSASPTSVAAGSNVTYTQSITNNGPAAATAPSFTQVTPPNTTFQSITPPAGWTCGTQPPVGGTGTITCTAATLTATSTANFTLVLQVNSGTPSGTSITETDTANASNIVPGLTTNKASATVIVGAGTSADMAIVKTGSPNPVTQGTPLTYTLAVTNNGPASATNVIVTDSLPSSVTYLSSNTTQGSCSEAGGTVTCMLGTMANAGTATVTILTIPGTAGIIANTATVTADQTDSNQANNTSTWNETVTAPTSVRLQSLLAQTGVDKNGARRAVLVWKTNGESRNLGFNVYRDVAGNRVRINPSLIAGSALMMSGALPRHSGRSYAFFDPSAPSPGTVYWLEDVDVNGTHTMHGPVSLASVASIDMPLSATRMFSQINQSQPTASSDNESHVVETAAATLSPTAAQQQQQFALASHSAVKILVRHEGWYRVAQADLVKAGLDPNVDPSALRLYAEAIEQPLQITGASAGPGGFGPQAAINFYGTGIDTIFSGTRIYWLVAGDLRGARIQRLPASSGSNQPPSNYPATVELKQHTTYFPALLTPDGDNFFGAFVSPTPVEQVLTTPHFDVNSTQSARLEIVLQGIIVAFPHDVQVALNGTTVANITFTGQDKGRLNIAVPPGLLRNWSNTITLTSQNGDYDTSLVQSIRISYPHTYEADSDSLKFSGRPGDELKISAFTSAPVVLDVTDPNRPVLVGAHSTLSNGEYSVALQVPWTTTNPSNPARHLLLAVADNRISAAAAVRPNHPSHWHTTQPGADIAIVTYQEFAAALAPLVAAHRAEGKSSAIIPVNDLYDEFNFGERSPFAIRQFLQAAQQNWKKSPSYLLLNGRASFDPRNYLGFGHLDLVPTRILPSSSLMTASDDWFSDFTDSGMPTIATGRLPVSTTDEANTVVSKIVSYAENSTNGPWTSNALIVADKDDAVSFSGDSEKVQAQLPSTMQVTDVFTSVVGTTAAQQAIVNGINSGQLLVNYLGHGSEEQWSGTSIFDTNSVGLLTNSSQLPVFLILDCLNGFFQDVYSQPLGVSLLLAPNGGGVAVLASTGLNQPEPQVKLDALVVQNALNASRPTLGEAILKAKLAIGDPGVRRTYVLLGDPAMRIKQPASGTQPH